jgi:peptide/nickel transport system substrate-binding protein/oligopeptide transport system substrate-binding protein
LKHRARSILRSRWNNHLPPGLYQLALPSALIISREAYRRDGSIIGSGPFALEEWKTDERIVLRASSGHRRPAEVERIMFRIVPEELSARFEFMNGTLDYYEISYLARASLGDTRYRSLTVPEYSVYYIALNNRHPQLGDIRLRQALNMAVDREAIRRMLFRDRFVSTVGPVPPGMAGYRTAAEGYAYDPETARQIIAGSGRSGREFETADQGRSSGGADGPDDPALSATGRAQGAHPQLEWTALRAITLSGNYDMALFTWHADYPEPENFLWPLFHSTNAGAGATAPFTPIRKPTPCSKQRAPKPTREKDLTSTGRPKT